MALVKPWSLLTVTFLLAPLSPLPAGELGDADFPRPSPTKRHDQKVQAVRAHAYDLVLVGDSITHTVGDFGGKYAPLKEAWDTYFAPHNAINLGYSGFRTEQVLWNLQNGELEFPRSPKVFMLLIGTNNTDERHFETVHSPKEIAAGTEAIVSLIRKKHPTSKILILRIFPRGGDDDSADSPPIFHSSAECIERSRKAGELTQRLADGQHIFWLDLNAVFRNADGSLNTEHLWDLLHPGPAGAAAWAKAVQPTLKKLLKGESAPARQTLTQAAAK